MTARRWHDADDYEPRQTVDDLPLFNPPPVRTMARAADPATSHDAALAIAERVTALQARVWAAFMEHGPMTGKELEALPELEDMGFSTARKRLGELWRRGYLRTTGTVRDGCQVYEAPRLDAA